MALFTFKVQFYDDIDEKERVQCGVVPGKDMAEAVKILDIYYKVTEILHLSIIDEPTDDVIPLPEEIMKKIQKGDYYNVFC